MAAEQIDVEIESAKLQHVEGMVDLGELFGLSRHRLVDMHQPGHPPGILPLGEGVHPGHRPVSAARLQEAVIDAGVHHLGQHQLRRRRHLLHAHGHVLDGVVFPVMRELELSETADAEIDVREAGPPFVSGAEQGLGVGARAIADSEGRGDRPGEDPLQVALVDVARRMSAGADPVREHVSVAIDDHVSLSGPGVSMVSPGSSGLTVRGSI